MSVARAHDGETLDGLLWRVARLGPSALAAALAANPRLCRRVTLTAGERITIPDVRPQTPMRARRSLWD